MLFDKPDDGFYLSGGHNTKSIKAKEKPINQTTTNPQQQQQQLITKKMMKVRAFKIVAIVFTSMIIMSVQAHDKNLRGLQEETSIDSVEEDTTEIGCSGGSGLSSTKVGEWKAEYQPAQLISGAYSISNFVGGNISLTDGGTGIFLNPGGDWVTLRAGVTDNTTTIGTLDVRTTIQMDDGSLVYMNYIGRIVFDQVFNLVYLASSPVFHTMSEKYGYLNDYHFVQRSNDGSILPTRQGDNGIVSYDLYRID